MTGAVMTNENRPLDRIPIEEMDIPIRAYNVLVNADIRTVGRLARTRRQWITRLKNAGAVTLRDIEAALVPFGVTLSDESAEDKRRYWARGSLRALLDELLDEGAAAGAEARPLHGWKVIDDIEYEWARATAKFPTFASAHEGYAVLLEEVDELWEAIKVNGSTEELRAEAVQVAAMAVRFIVDVCEKPRGL